MTEVINFLQLLSFATPTPMNNYLCAELIVVQGVFIVKEKIYKYAIQKIIFHRCISFNEFCFCILLPWLESVIKPTKEDVLNVNFLSLVVIVNVNIEDTNFLVT